MVFSSPIFLFGFLPIVLAGALLTRKHGQNAFLLLASLIFYTWGEVSWAWVIFASIAVNYVCGLWLSFTKRKKAVIVFAIVANLGLLAVFKYANFVVHDFNTLVVLAGARPIELAPVHLPIGISFFTFHALSYLIDVYRGQAEPQRNPVDFALYITMFPQLIAGPIIRYHDIADQLVQRRTAPGQFAIGVRRFVMGLAKKVLIANTVAQSADAIFALPAADLTSSVAWAGTIFYALQIYFDFSAYSDMAIGLGRMFGFRFLENFEYPYVARSVTEFWRRWHISLSRWFRDYLYIPLGGNRLGPRRTYFNLLIVFFLCGLWHGASWSFVVWGLYHGAFLILERTRFGALLERAPRPLRHVYLLGVVMIGWVFFRADTLPQALLHLRAMAGIGTGQPALVRLPQFLPSDVILATAAGIVGSAPFVPWLAAQRERLRSLPGLPARLLDGGWRLAGAAIAACLFLASAALLASGTYNPFIYFRF